MHIHVRFDLLQLGTTQPLLTLAKISWVAVGPGSAAAVLRQSSRRRISAGSAESSQSIGSASSSARCRSIAASANVVFSWGREGM